MKKETYQNFKSLVYDIVFILYNYLMLALRIYKYLVTAHFITYFFHSGLRKFVNKTSFLTSGKKSLFT